jgi:hypothetical protein
MDSKIKLGEIVYCNMTIYHKKKYYKLKKVVYKNENNLFYKKKHLDPLNIKEPVIIHDIEIISRLGFENKAKGYTEVKRSEEQRNNITGAYE